MRISAGSSDVCSSDLPTGARLDQRLVGLAALQRGSGDGDRPCHPGPGVRGDRLLSVGPWLADMDRPQMAQAPALPGFPETLNVIMVRLPFEGVDAGARRVSYGWAVAVVSVRHGGPTIRSRSVAGIKQGPGRED